MCIRDSLQSLYCGTLSNPFIVVKQAVRLDGPITFPQPKNDNTDCEKTTCSRVNLRSYLNSVIQKTINL